MANLPKNLAAVNSTSFSVQGFLPPALAALPAALQDDATGRRDG